MSSSKLFPGVGKAVDRSNSSAEGEVGHSSSSSRSSSTGRGVSGGGNGSRDNTPIIARYAILSAASGVGTGAVAAGTVVEGRGVTSSVVVGSAALLLDVGGGGEPRSSTPARLSRVLTPLKGQNRRLTHAMAGTATIFADLQAREDQQRQQAEAAAAAAGQRRIERRSRRKMRRWANDRLLGVAQICSSLHNGGLEGEEESTKAVAEGEYGPFVDRAQISNFSTLMAAENTDLRERFLAGYGEKRGAETRRARGRSTPSLLKDAEARFLRLESRLRRLLTQLVGTDAHMGLFLEDVEALLRRFMEGGGRLLLKGSGGAGARKGAGGHGGEKEDSKIEGGSEALARWLARPLYVKKDSLVLPLNNSAFFRLLIHGCCQYYGLRSHSENLPQDSGEAEEVRAVVVAKPSAMLAASWSANSSMTMCDFIKNHRLNQHLVPKRRGGRCLNEASEEECVVARAVAPVVLKPVKT
ncbi:Hypothetical protein NocV09_02800090 [Nannochloropsis oceanica]